MRAGYDAHALAQARLLHATTAAYDLPLYHVLLQILLAAGGEGEAQEVLDRLSEAGHDPTERTLNVLIKGFVSCGSLTAALEVFNSFCAAGGYPALLTYNILIDGFARGGQLLNAEALTSQLRMQGLEPDAYTYNALIRAAVNARRAPRALAYRRLMLACGVELDAVSLTLLTDAYAATERPLQAVADARAAIEAVEAEGHVESAHADAHAATQCGTALLDTPLGLRLLAACSQASDDPLQAEDAREYALWVLDAACRLPRSNAEARWRAQPAVASTQGAADLLSHPNAVRDLIRIFGKAGDFEGARGYFELAERPRPFIVWSEMVKVCNACGNTALASQILAEMDE